MVLVSVKQGLGYDAKPAAKVDGAGIDYSNVKMRMNPAEEIIPVSIGQTKAPKMVLTALPWGYPRDAGR